MPVLSSGCIGSLTLPESFVLADKPCFGLGDSFLKTAVCKQNKVVQICLYYRGRPLALEFCKDFRLLLKNSPSSLFDSANPDSEVFQKFRLNEVLENVSDNQLVNKTSGRYGPRFFLESMDVRDCSSRNVLFVRGYFHGPEGEAEIAYAGVFVDANPLEKRNCRIEEIFLQTPPDHFDKYFPVFMESLSGICWS